eukprot:scaffold130092_cov16-Tisochrysis_lutea.AAC.1
MQASLTHSNHTHSAMMLNCVNLWNTHALGYPLVYTCRHQEQGHANIRAVPKLAHRSRRRYSSSQHPQEPLAKTPVCEHTPSLTLRAAPPSTTPAAAGGKVAEAEGEGASQGLVEEREAIDVEDLWEGSHWGGSIAGGPSEPGEALEETDGAFEGADSGWESEREEGEEEGEARIQDGGHGCDDAAGGGVGVSGGDRGNEIGEVARAGVSSKDDAEKGPEQAGGRPALLSVPASAAAVEGLRDAQESEGRVTHSPCSGHTGGAAASALMHALASQDASVSRLDASVSLMARNATAALCGGGVGGVRGASGVSGGLGASMCT